MSLEAPAIRGTVAWIAIALLLLSLAINILVGGFVLGRMHAGKPPSDFDHLIGFISQPYPLEIQRTIRDGANVRRAELMQQLNALGNARAHTYLLEQTEPFDAAKLAAAESDVRDAVATLQQTVQGIEAAAIAGAPADVRQRIKPPHGAFQCASPGRGC
jgi:hypothetical protein